MLSSKSMSCAAIYQQDYIKLHNNWMDAMMMTVNATITIMLFIADDIDDDDDGECNNNVNVIIVDDDIATLATMMIITTINKWST